MVNARKTLNLSFTRLDFFDHYLISTVKEDILLEEKHITELRNICFDYFGKKPFAYIANRVNNYNVNPLIYLNLLTEKSLKGIAIVSLDLSRLQTANFEKQFSPVPLELFQNPDEAKVWAKGIATSK